MRSRPRLVLASLISAAVIATAVSSASANDLSINADTFRLIWSALSIETSLTRTTCPVTLAGSFHRRTFTKETDLIGHITSASVADASCTGGRARFDTGTLPWHFSYFGFFGELPTMDGVFTLEAGMTLLIVAAGVTCRFETDMTEPGGGLVWLDASGQVTSFQANSNFEIDLDTPGVLCDIMGDAALSGSASATTGGGGTLVVDLI